MHSQGQIFIMRSHKETCCMRSNADVPFSQPAATQSPHSEVGFCPSSQASLMTGLMLHMAPGTLELQPKDLTPSRKEDKFSFHVVPVICSYPHTPEPGKTRGRR